MGGKKKKSTGGVIKRDSKFKIPRVYDCPLCDGKASIKIELFKTQGYALISCRACKQPEPAYKARFDKFTEKHNAFLEYYDWLRRKDAEQLERNNIVVQPVETMRRQPLPSDALEGSAADGAMALEDDDADAEIADLLG